jgi:hypothetical protein
MRCAFSALLIPRFMLSLKASIHFLTVSGPGRSSYGGGGGWGGGLKPEIFRKRIKKKTLKVSSLYSLKLLFL